MITTVCLKQANSANVNFSVIVLLLRLKKANGNLLTFLATEECKRLINVVKLYSNTDTAVVLQ